jgi:hypothetical protein
VAPPAPREESPRPPESTLVQTPASPLGLVPTLLVGTLGEPAAPAGEGVPVGAPLLVSLLIGLGADAAPGLRGPPAPGGDAGGPGASLRQMLEALRRIFNEGVPYVAGLVADSWEHVTAPLADTVEVSGTVLAIALESLGGEGLSGGVRRVSDLARDLARALAESGAAAAGQVRAHLLTPSRGGHRPRVPAPAVLDEEANPVPREEDEGAQGQLDHEGAKAAAESGDFRQREPEGEGSIDPLLAASLFASGLSQSCLARPEALQGPVRRTLQVLSTRRRP